MKAIALRLVVLLVALLLVVTLLGPMLGTVEITVLGVLALAAAVLIVRNRPLRTRRHVAS